NKLGDIARAEGDLPAARAAFQAGLTIRDRLAARDPGNSEWQRDLFVSQFKIADLAARAGDTAEARRQFSAARAVIGALAARFPDHPGFRKDLAMIDQRLSGLG
ncbi:MAG: hypothetical protein ACOYO0_07405, partial [Sandarakinorhabdus sp.]